ncbi:Uncharacterised protein [Legionella pneumophila]|nr:Uncharacterised protein [Legionella pneumophila]
MNNLSHTQHLTIARIRMATNLVLELFLIINK